MPARSGRATGVNVVHVLPRRNGDQTTEDRGQRTEDRERRTENGGVPVASNPPLRLFQRPQAFDNPFALVDSAGLALHPGFAFLANVARQEVVADESVLGVGRGDRGDRAACSAARVFPRGAGTLAAPA